jgi:hypothetical protein
MATNPPGSGKVLISVGVPVDVLREIDARAEQLRWSRNAYVVALLQRWFVEGARPVDVVEDVSLRPVSTNPADPLAPLTYVGAKLNVVARPTRETALAAEAPQAPYVVLAKPARPKSPSQTRGRPGSDSAFSTHGVAS